MNSQRLTATEKGKGPLRQSQKLPSKRIKAPEIDPSTLFSENILTLFGRVSNPTEQPIDALIPSLPRQWVLKGTILGSDLGQSCFQFRFELEEDLVKVLANRPYHYAYWMLMIQRWEPSLSPQFPSQISFWIRLHGLPLHYWHEKMIYKIGQDLGTLEDYHISKTSAKMQVSVDGLKPLIKEAIVEFGSGEELTITLTYEGLENHCSVCNQLDHVTKHCPFQLHRRNYATEAPSRDMSGNKYPHTSSVSYGNQAQHNPVHSEPSRSHHSHTDFSNRVDRHGRPFGERASTIPLRGQPLKNKVTPQIQS